MYVQSRNCNNFSGACFCSKYGCNGADVSTKTFREHNRKRELPVAVKQTLLYKYKLTYDESLYETHHAANTKLHAQTDMSVLEMCYLKLKPFAFHPGLSKAAISSQLETDKRYSLPQPNNLPSSYQELRKTVADFLLPLEKVYMCQNDCMALNSDKECTSVDCNLIGPQVSERTFTFCPFGPKLSQYFGSVNLAQILQYHCTSEEIRSIGDIQDTVYWHEHLYGENGVFNGDKRGGAVHMSTDGLVPWRAIGSKYSMWPIDLQLLNLPPIIRKTVGGLHLYGIVPGQKEGGPKSLEPYLKIVVDEMLALSGATIKDVHVGDTFECKVELVHYVLDFPGIAKVFNIATGGYSACPWCRVHGEWNYELHKTIYLENRVHLGMYLRFLTYLCQTYVNVYKNYYLFGSKQILEKVSFVIF